ncbi:protein PSK SIMULATOR 1 isoform X1 [Ziziphus jujuba]|uniref:Protein PSK SIMULATOR 1 isoform X1 n=1 Tax=Ziziphus jujuba TaxID=326968 RepID=A0ABM3ITR2_ZIZJJ|nr:protein PSK SIMULATOR 1 isoform X1 [Ziziphus jujuba]
MGGLCSKSSNSGNVSAEKNWDSDRHKYAAAATTSSYQKTAKAVVTPPMPADVQRGMTDKKLPDEREPVAVPFDAVAVDDEFYDGIPRYPKALTQKSRSVRSTQAAVAKVSAGLGRAGTVGFGKAVEVLDSLGSSMTNLNAGSGFNSTAPIKGSEIAILSFEIANTIVKGSNLMQSLSNRSIKQLKEVVLPSKGVQHLISKDMDELLRIVAADKREELKIFSGEVVRFGNRSKDSQWHNLDRYFEKISRELSPQKNLKDEAETVMLQLMTLVQYTAELYHELHALDRFEQDYLRKCQEESATGTQKGDSIAILRTELKSQRKLVKNLKKKSLWSKSLEEVMEKLVDIVHFLHLQIHNTFGTTDAHKPVEGSTNSRQRLGPAGLSLHYANIVIQIDTIVARSSNVPQNTKDALYQNLPPNLKLSLRSKLQSFRVKDELTVTEIKAEMEKTLQWLVPIATNTAKAHHGFGWVGEWANTGSELNRKAAVQTDVIQIETLHHADKEKTESCLLELVLWLHHLITQSMSSGKNGVSKSPPKSTALLKTNQQSKAVANGSQSANLTSEEQEMLKGLTKNRRMRGISKSQDFDNRDTGLRRHSRLSKSSSYSPRRGNRELLSFSRFASGIHVVDFGIDKEKALDVIDRVDSRR